jgi:exodeoxyribonuclease VII small subunit
MSTAQPAELSFEQAMERLEVIASSMEESRMSLEEMVASYEEGSKLLLFCRQRLDSARHRVEMIHQKGASAELQPFQPQEEPAELSTKTPATPAARTPARRKPAPTTDDDEIRLF